MLCFWSSPKKPAGGGRPPRDKNIRKRVGACSLIIFFFLVPILFRPHRSIHINQHYSVAFSVITDNLCLITRLLSHLTNRELKPSYLSDFSIFNEVTFIRGRTLEKKKERLSTPKRKGWLLKQRRKSLMICLGGKWNS